MSDTTTSFAPTLSFDGTNVPVAMYNGTGEPADGLALRLLQTDMQGSHAGTAHSSLHIESNPAGSGINGPWNADFGLSIRHNKQNWTSTTTPGEIDGLNIVVRQGGMQATSFDTSSDACAILGNVQSIGDCGYHGAMEMAVSRINKADHPTAPYAINRSVAVQVGIIDDFGGNPYSVDNPARWVPNPVSFGFMANSVVGPNDIAFYANNGGQTPWKWAFLATGNTGQKIGIKGDTGNIVWGSGNHEMTLTNNAGNLVWINAVGQGALSLTQTGAASFRGQIGALHYEVNGSKVVGARQSAIPNAATGTEVSTINAILNAMRSHGLIAT